MSQLLSCYNDWSLSRNSSVVRKPINLIEDWRKLLFHVLNSLVKVSFAYFCFSRLSSSNVKFSQISALNNIWE